MFRWLAELFAKKCPSCGSTRIYERDVFSFTYFIFYGCSSCGHQWKEDGS